MSRFVARNSAQAGGSPGVCGPFSSALANAFGSSPNFDQPVRNRTQAPFGISPFTFSQASICETSRRKSGFAADSFTKSKTTAGPTRRCGGIEATSSPSFPVIQ